MINRPEGRLTRLVEKQTSKVPSIIFLGAAGASVVAALISYMTGRRQAASFIGEWAPTLLLLGMYNKFVKEAT